MSNREETVLLTGARGFIGRAIGDHMAMHGYRVLAHDIREPDEDAAAHPSIAPIASDLLDSATMDELMALEFDGIVHTAWSWDEDPLSAAKNNVLAFERLASLAVQRRLRRFLFIGQLSRVRRLEQRSRGRDGLPMPGSDACLCCPEGASHNALASTRQAASWGASHA